MATLHRPLRGTRYLKDPAWGELIQNELPCLDLDETLAFYERFEPRLSDNDKALLNCNDRFYLLTITCKRKDAWHPWIFNRCREVEADPDGHLDLWARYHYKSSIGTFAGVIQEILIDPEITIAILSGTSKVAQPFLKQIMEELETNSDLKRQHPDVLFAEPRKESPQWSIDKGIICRRRGNPKEATVEAFGLIDGNRPGKHYDLLDYDDLIDESMVDNPDIVKKVTLRWELSDNLGSLEGTRKWHWGTRYSFADTYGIILDRGVLKERRYPATDNGQLNGAPILLSKDRWADVKKAQRSTVNAQMLLNPLAGNEATFNTRTLRHYDVIPSMMNVYIMCDPSKGSTKRSDKTAIAVVGVDIGSNKYLLDGYCHRMKLSRRFELISQLREKWEQHPGVQYVRVGYEQYGMQSDLEVMREYQIRDDDHFEIEELATPRDGKYSKTDRISRLEPDFNRGLFYLPCVVHHPDFGTNAYWDIWTEEDSKRMIDGGASDNNVPIGNIVFRPAKGPTRAQRACEVTFQKYRIVTAIKRLDEDNDVYDLTRTFIEEFRLHPFAPHDDFLDATSRVFDLEPNPPVPFEALKGDPRTHMDS